MLWQLLLLLRQGVAANYMLPPQIRQYIQVPAPKASFFGHEYLSYDFSESRNGVNSREEELSIMFKTTRPDAMLFYAGDIQDYIHVALKGGAAVATSNLGSGPRNITIDPFVMDGGLKFNDNHWHHLILHRRLTTHSRGPSKLQMSLRVDGQHAAVEQTEGHMEWLSHVVAYVAARPTAKILPARLLTTPFVGCLTKVRYRADNRYLDFLEMAKKSVGSSKPGIVRMQGNLSFSCRDASAPVPISILSSDAFLLLPSWQSGHKGTIAFKFRTNEPDGLILYNGGPGLNASSDYIAFELVEGLLYVTMSLGSGHLRLQASTQRLLDKSEWHSVTLIREGVAGSILVDHLKTEFYTPGNAKNLDLGGDMYIGGVEWPGGKAAPSPIPSSVYTASLRAGFMGCFRDLTLNGVTMDLVNFLHQPTARRQVEGGCSITVDMCPAQPCLNGGRCSEGWRRHKCDCAKTPKEGPTCARDPMRVSFTKENQLLRVALPAQETSEAEDIQVKFQTHRTAGFLIGTSSSSHFDRVELTVFDSQLFLELQFGTHRLKPVSLTGEVGDGRWHTVSIKRRGDILRFSLDGNDPDSFEILGGKSEVLHYDTFWAGHSQVSVAGPRQPFDAGNIVPKVGFMGQMAGFSFNGIEVFKLAADLEQGLPFAPPSNVTTRLRAGDWTKEAERIVSFVSRSGFLQLPESLIATAPLLHASFHFRTLQDDGLILFANGLSRDFFAVELTEGQIRYSFDSGDGPQSLLSKTQGRRLNDFAWHRVQVYQATAAEHFLVVDNATTKLTVEGSNNQLNLRGVLSVGGVEASKMASLPAAVVSRVGYRGCLASFTMSRTPVDLLNDHLRMEGVMRDCQGPEVKCTSGSCENEGVCRQHWSSISCDCAMTTYAGTRCESPSTGYVVGPGSGALVWEWPEGQRPSTGADVLALGLQTRSEADSVLFRVDSRNPKDFLQLEISGGGFASVSYNLGGQSYRVGDMMHRVNDGKYHVVRFTRDAANATFQLDRYSRQYKSPTGQQLETLNQQAWMTVGGRVEMGNGGRRRRAPLSAPRILQPFSGTIRGLNFNNIFVLEKAAEGDKRVTKLGSVALLREHERGPNRVHVIPSDDDFLSTDIRDKMHASSSVGPTDDVIITTGSGAGSGCQSDEQISEDDECVYESDPDNNELITPDYERMFTSTPRTTPTTTPTTTSTSTSTTSTTTTSTTSPTTTSTTTSTTTTTTTTTTPRPTPPPTPTPVYYEETDDEMGEGSGGEIVAPALPSTVNFRDFTPPQPPIQPPPKPTLPSNPITRDLFKGVTMDVPPRPTAPGGIDPGPNSGITTTPTPAPGTKEETFDRTGPTAPGGIDPGPNSGITTTPTPAPGTKEETFDRTGFISGISIALILFTALVVFLVFKCYSRSKAGGAAVNSYSVEEPKAGLYAPDVPAPVLTTRVSALNGYSPMKPVTAAAKKNKDFKEWYV